MPPVRERLLTAALVAAGLAGSGCRSAAEADERRLTELLERIRADYRVPALAAALVRDGRIVAAGAVGVRRMGPSEPVTIDDRFHVGSVSKPITATVIATLVEARKLDWTTTVGAVFPEFAGHVRPEYLGVTLEQLLSHRAGLLAWEEDEELALAPQGTGTPRQRRRQAVAWLLGQAPVAPPGTEHVYSNAGYMVAAAMAEQVTGTEWEALVRDRLGKPLGLDTLGFGWPAASDPRQPWGHRPSGSGFEPHDPNDDYRAGPLLGPAGDIHMSIVDLARFAQLHLEGQQGKPRLLTAATFRKLHAPIDDYALGWNVRDTADHHLGGMGTFVAAIWVSVPRDAAVVVATNADASEKLVSAVINGTLIAFGVPKARELGTMGDTVASMCDISDALHGLPAEPLGRLFRLMSSRQPLRDCGPVDMLKVFISEHLCDDVEDRFGPYAGRQFTMMAGKDFMMTLTFDRAMGTGATLVGRYMAERLVHWNRHYERLLLQRARQHGIQEIVTALAGSGT